VTGPALFFGANHREAPITSLDHKADIADFFTFRSYDPAAADSLTMILNVDPLLEPSNGPNYFPFDPEILYAIHIDNNHDAVADMTFEFRFQTEYRLPGVFTGFVGAGTAGIPAPPNSPPPVAPGTIIVPKAITALDGPGSEGLGLRQQYSVVLLQNNRRTVLGSGIQKFAVPTNVGPRTMPNYTGLAAQGNYNLGNGIRVFAGTVEDPFWIDLGAAFDSLNFRTSGFTPPGVLNNTQDADDTQNFAADDVSGFNVNSIVIELPLSTVLRSGTPLPPTDPRATIGAWGTTSRPRITVRGGGGFMPDLPYRQVQRMGNPLINELIIGTGAKDTFSMSPPVNDSQFANFFLDPLLARVFNAVHGGSVAIPTPPRNDLLPLVQYLPPIAPANTPPGPVADLLRINTGVPPTPPAEAKRLALLAHDAAGNPTPDPAGFPNGRRVFDDVTDIAARVVAGVLAGTQFDRFPNNRIGDGVNKNDMSYRNAFPYLGLAHSGRDSRHIDPLESGCAPTGICPKF
jgi:hypothetical protein